MADITMSLDDTLELDAIIQKWNPKVIGFNEIPDSSDGNILTGFQTKTGVLDPDEPGIYKITVNGQELTVEVTDPNTIPDSVLLPSDGDLNNFTGDTSSFTISSSPTLTESKSLVGSGDKNILFSKNGLKRYPEPGFVWSVYFNPISKDESTRMIYFGADDINNNYAIYIRPKAATSFGIFKDNFNTVLEDTGSSNISTSKWYEVEVEWHTNGKIVARLFDVDQSTGDRGSQIYSDLSANDSSYLDQTGIGFNAGRNGSGVSGNESAWTGWRLIEKI